VRNVVERLLLLAVLFMVGAAIVAGLRHEPREPRALPLSPADVVDNPAWAGRNVMVAGVVVGGGPRLLMLTPEAGGDPVLRVELGHDPAIGVGEGLHAMVEGQMAGDGRSMRHAVLVSPSPPSRYRPSGSP